jgi:hypothetical protein
LSAIKKGETAELLKIVFGREKSNAVTVASSEDDHKSDKGNGQDCQHH